MRLVVDLCEQVRPGFAESLNLPNHYAVYVLSSEWLNAKSKRRKEKETVETEHMNGLNCTFKIVPRPWEVNQEIHGKP